MSTVEKKINRIDAHIDELSELRHDLTSVGLTTRRCLAILSLMSYEAESLLEWISDLVDTLEGDRA